MSDRVWSSVSDCVWSCVSDSPEYLPGQHGQTQQVAHGAEDEQEERVVLLQEDHKLVVRPAGAGVSGRIQKGRLDLVKASSGVHHLLIAR